MSKVLIPMANGFEEIEAVTIIDILRRGGIEVITASISDSLSVKGAHGIEMMADAKFAEVGDDDYEAIVLPGGGEGTERLRNSDEVINRIVRQREEERLLAAICAAPLVLADAGVLEDSHQATCYPTCQMEMPCQWINEPVVEHDGIITSQAPGTAVIFALVVLQTLAGEAVARKVARGLVYEF